MVTKGADGGLNGAVDTPFAAAQTRSGPEDAPRPGPLFKSCVSVPEDRSVDRFTGRSRRWPKRWQPIRQD